MRTIRHADNSDASNILRLYIKAHFELQGITVDEYIQAIVNDDIPKLINGMLAFKRSVQYDVGAPLDTITTTLISA